MSNEAAERIEARMAEIDAERLAKATRSVRLAHGSVVAAIEATERRATVERIKHAILFQRTRLGTPPEKIRVTDLLAILDAEAER